MSTTLPKILVTRKIPAAGLACLDGKANYRILRTQGVPSYDEVKAAVRGADAILPLLTERIDGDILDNAPTVKVVANMAVGFDNVDVAAATARGVMVTNTPGVLTETTADFAWALLMAAARRVVEGDRFTRDGRWKTWEPEGLLGQDLYGATLGIIGFGRIGSAVARRAVGFDMDVIYYNPSPLKGEARQVAEDVGARSADFEELMRESDFISVHVPLTADTRHLIGEGALALVKPTAVLVNTSRGPVVDPAALYQALSSGGLWAAALDVFEKEPVVPDDPLLSLPNLVVAPHLGSASVTTRNRMAVMAAENALAALAGHRPPNLVNGDVWKG